MTDTKTLEFTIAEMSKTIRVLQRKLNSLYALEDQSEKNIVHRHNMWSSGVPARQLVVAGVDPDLACQRTAARFDMPIETVTHYMQRVDQARDAAAKEARDRDIIRRARRGETNLQISLAWKVSRRTVTRVIAAHRRRAAKGHPIRA
jgi:DNA-binding NarL/FixJ family response regulator